MFPHTDTSSIFSGSVDVYKQQTTKQLPWVCGLCGKDFQFKSALERHSISHTGAKGFFCDTCGRGFASKQSSQFHKFAKHH